MKFVIDRVSDGIGSLFTVSVEGITSYDADSVIELLKKLKEYQEKEREKIGKAEW